LASLAQHGQQMPIVVVGAGPHVVVDGYKRVRALQESELGWRARSAIFGEPFTPSRPRP
jgi:ParB-like chromosome segregation protein Spo0J